jgi:hypothetical protein
MLQLVLQLIYIKGFSQKNKMILNTIKNHFYQVIKKVNTVRFIELVFIIGCLLSLIIPWFVPVVPSISDSYYYGFSNKIALLILIITIGISYWLLLLNKSNIFSIDDKYFSEELNKPRLKYKFVYIIFIVTYLIFLFILNYTHRFLDYGEASYFVKRIYLMQDGLKPYLDFEFAYGSFMVYFPYFLHVFFNLQAPIAYSLSLIIEIGIGYITLWYLIKTLNSYEYINIVFLQLFLTTIALAFMGGVNYTLFRFVTPIFITVSLFNNLIINYSKFKVFIYPILIFIFGYNISPELGITSTFGFVLMYNYRELSTKGVILSTLSLTAIALIIIFSPFYSKSFITLLTFSNGGNNLPWFISPTILIFFIFIFISIVLINYKRDKIDKRENAKLLIILISVLNLPGAMGRCDFGHLFLYGFGFFLLVTSVIPYLMSSYLRKKVTIMLYGIMGFMIFSTIILYSHPGGKLLISFYNEINTKNQLNNKNENNSDVNLFISDSKHKPLIINSYPELFENSVLRKKVEFPYFIDGMNQFSYFSTNIVCEEIEKHKALVLNKNYKSTYEFNALPKKFIFILFGIIPYGHKTTNPSIINNKILHLIQDDFEQKDTIKDSNYIIYERKNPL